MTTTASRRPTEPQRLSGHRGTSGRASLRLVAFILVPLLGLGALVVYLQERIRDHDDPIVIDNPKIEVYRKSLERDPGREYGVSEKWSVGAIATIVGIVVTSTDKDGGTHSETMPASDADEFTFYKVASGPTTTPLFVIRRGGFLFFEWGQVAPLGDLTFKHRDKENGQVVKKIVQEKGGDPHIGQITFGQSAMCVADGKEPTKEACKSGTYTPKSLKVEIMLKHY